MFDEAMSNKFSFNDLDPKYCYHFILIHYKNKNIVTYKNFEREYKELYHVLTTEKYTLDEVDVTIKNINKVEEEKFQNLEELTQKIDEISKQDENQKRITTEGYIIKLYDGQVKKSPFKLLKLQTEVYQTIMKIKPNNSNIYQSYLELYQKDQLVDFLPYFSKYNNDIKRIHSSMKTLAKEVLDLYHITRQKKNPTLYSNLPEQYKKVLYGLHGLYIDNRKQDFHDGREREGDREDRSSKSINVHDVYHFLKNLPPSELRQLYFERMSLSQDANKKLSFINHNCIFTKTQISLMFKTTNKK